jgi:hypothetical protein
VKMAITPKTITCSMLSLWKFLWHLHRNRKISLEIDMEIPKTSNNQSSSEQKNPMLKASQYPTSEYTTEL